VKRVFCFSAFRLSLGHLGASTFSAHVILCLRLPAYRCYGNKAKANRNYFVLFAHGHAKQHFLFARCKEHKNHEPSTLAHMVFLLEVIDRFPPE
jgi:hypothetical protein